MSESAYRARGPFLHDSKIYYFQSQSHSSIHYKCAKKGCKGRLYKSKETDKIEVTGKHTCLVSKIECDAERVNKRIRHLALTTDLTPCEVLRKALVGSSPSVIRALATRNTICRNIRKWRQKNRDRNPSRTRNVTVDDDDDPDTSDDSQNGDDDDDRNVEPNENLTEEQLSNARKSTNISDDNSDLDDDDTSTNAKDLMTHLRCHIRNKPRRRGIVADNKTGYEYYHQSNSHTSYHLVCRYKDRGCPGRGIQSKATEKIQETKPHTCNIDPELRGKEAAIERLRELTLSVEGSAKAVELVRKVLKDLSPEVRALMPTEDSLIHRVRRWARSSNIQLVKATADDFLIQEGEEPLIGFQGMTASGNDPTTSSAKENPATTEDVTKTGVIYTEPVSNLAECEDRKPAGLIFLKGKVNGHYQAVIEGQMYHWKGSVSDERFLYACREAQIGCPVTVVVDNVRNKYELRGNHKHDLRKRDKRLTCRPIKSLKKVDEDGNEIGVASLYEFISGAWQEGTEGKGQGIENCTSLEENPTPVESSSYPVENEDADDDNDFMDHEGDDFQTGFDPEPIPKTPLKPSRAKSPFVVSTSSIPPARKPSGKRLPKDAVKSGEHCFVCGDELIVSETLGASEGTFRTACRYLNVKSDGEWFPTIQNAKFYSFCESCTNEINRIHDLYKKVEEIQSLIFKKVESVEKRIADAEIVDNWMAEAPHSTAVRFEGFRKQVMINYRNKLKLRREIRFGEKIGHPLVEIQPTSSAHMFAKDPTDKDDLCTSYLDDHPQQSEHQVESETTTTRAIETRRTRGRQPKSNTVPDNVDSKHSESAATEKSDTPQPARRPRGRPKSKKPMEEEEAAKIVIQAEEAPSFEHAPSVGDDDTNVIEDDSFHHDFDDSQEDAMSVTSEREVKFWEEDPSKLEVNRRRTKTKTSQTVVDNDDEDYDYEQDNDDDSDYEEDDDDADEDWGAPKKKRQKSSKVSKEKSSTSSGSGWPLQKLKIPDGPRTIIFEDKKSKKKALKKSPPEPKPKTVKTCKTHNIKFPDAVLTKDGRVFMEGIEIIKNPPGVYKLRPYSISFTCGACGKIARGFWCIRHHICGHHLSLFKCHICQKEFTDAKFVKKHIEMVHEEPIFQKCPTCEKPVRAYKKLSMLRHRWTHLSKEEKQDPQYKDWAPPSKDPDRKAQQTYMCGQCGKTFYMPTALKRHELTHDPDYESSLMCQYCGKTYSRRKGLSQHVWNCARKAQGHVNLVKYPCPKCSIRFTTRGARSKHLRKFHSDGKHVELPFSCPKCPRSFSTRSGFKSHKRVCVDGEKGNNNKQVRDDPIHSTASASCLSSFKTDPPAEVSLPSAGRDTTTVGLSNPQYNSASMLGFSYNFMGSAGDSYENNKEHYH